SESRAPPACQIPPPGLPSVGTPGVGTATSVHCVVIAPLVALTPTTQPRYGGRAPRPPQAPLTAPALRRKPARFQRHLGADVAVGSLSAAPWITTGKFGRSAPVAMSMACASYSAGPEVPDAYVLENR